MTHEEFSMFVDPRNECGKLLQSHFAALQLIMTPVTLSNRQARRPSGMGGDGVTVRWLSNLHKQTHPEFMKYYEWPIAIEKAVYDNELPLVFS